MKVMFYEPYARYSPHFERCLELMQIHIDKGDEVFYVGCNAKVATCELNLFHYSSICKACISRRNQGLALLSKSVKVNDCVYLKADQKTEIDNFLANLHFQSIAELKNIEYQGFDIGMGVASSLISHLRNPNLDTKRYKKLILNFFKSSLQIYLSLGNYIEENGINSIYLFNGRYAQMRPAIRIAAKLGIDFYAHEVGGSIHKYATYKNMLPHEIQKRILIIKDFWDTADKETREDIGAAFFNDQATGKVAHQRYYHTKDQKENMLPKGWDESKTNLVIFNSSEDEFAAISNKNSLGIYASQFEGIQQIVAHFKDRSDYQIYLRVHPNLRKANKKIVEKLYEIEAFNFSIIPPDSPVSTYTLVSETDAVITFVSTVGIEAAFRGKIAIILGDSLYNHLGSTYHPKTHEEAMEMLNKVKELPVKDKTGALIYGYYRKNNGTPYKYYEPETLFKGKYKGKAIEVPFPLSLTSKFFGKLQWLRKYYLP